MLNCVFMTWAADDEIRTYASGPSRFVKIVDEVFLGAYMLEFLIKFWRHRFYYFVDEHWRYNLMDFVLLLIGVYTVFLSETLSNVTFLRMLRILKLAKALRVLRLVAAVKPLRALLASLTSTIGTLCWSLIMLTAVLYLFALIFVLRIASFLQTGFDELGTD